MQLTLERILELAPDAASVTAAEKIVTPGLWQSLGLNEDALWGIFGKDYFFQVRVDLTGLGYQCGCPSRKFPCKHVLALLFLFAKIPDLFQITKAPDWVQAWLEKRRQRAEQHSRKEMRAKLPVDSAAQEKRVYAREIKIRAGLDQLSLWMDDLIRDGIAALESKPFSFWDTQARRMVDAQAKGLANRIRNMAQIPGSASVWPQRLLDELGRTRLLVHAYQRLETLSSDLQAEVRQLIGWTISQAELEETSDVVTDDWLIFGQQIEQEEHFRSQRNWAIGSETGREAMLLQFAPGKQGFPLSVTPGTIYSGELLFYPGTVRQRATFRPSETLAERFSVALPDVFEKTPASESIEEYLDKYAKRLARNPWLTSTACVLNRMRLSQRNGNWFICDQQGCGLRLDSRIPFQLLAETGGEPFLAMGEWNGNRLSLLSYSFHSRFRVMT